MDTCKNLHKSPENHAEHEKSITKTTLYMIPIYIVFLKCQHLKMRPD